MSAILKTLKKLEEEKNLVEQNLDIEEMVKQAEVLVPSATRKRKTGLVASLLGLAGVLFTGYFVYLPNRPELPFAELPVVKSPAFPPIVEESPIPKTNPLPKRTSVASGIPLAQIPETEEVTPALEKEKPVKVVNQKTEPPEKPNLETETPLEEIKEPAPMVALNEINTLIEEAKLAAEVERATPPQLKPRRNAIYIPGLKVKGIVYLAENNPVNHILVSTPNNPNKKLKVGQSALGATLKAIHSNKAVFSYRGQTTVTGIGE